MNYFRTSSLKTGREGENQPRHTQPKGGTWKRRKEKSLPFLKINRGDRRAKQKKIILRETPVSDCAHEKYARETARTPDPRSHRDCGKGFFLKRKREMQEEHSYRALTTISLKTRNGEKARLRAKEPLPGRERDADKERGGEKGAREEYPIVKSTGRQHEKKGQEKNCVSFFDFSERRGGGTEAGCALRTADRTRERGTLWEGRSNQASRETFVKAQDSKKCSHSTIVLDTR